MDDLQLLSQRDVSDLLNVSVETIRRWRQENDFPLPLKQTGRSMWWARWQIEAWQKKDSGNKPQ